MAGSREWSFGGGLGLYMICMKVGRGAGEGGGGENGLLVSS